MRNLRHLGHVVYAFAALHLSVLASDHFKDAYAATLVDRAFGFVSARLVSSSN